MAKTNAAYAPEYRRQSGEPASRSSWFGRAARPVSWLASLNVPRRRSATGCTKPIATRVGARTA